MDPKYIDVMDESKKALGAFTYEVASSLQIYSSLSDMAFRLFSGTSFLLVPKQKIGAVISETTDGFVKSAILSYVLGGGTLLYTSMGDHNSLIMQNQLFGWNVTSANCSSINTRLDTAKASSTSFAGGPAALPPVDATRCVKGT